MGLLTETNQQYYDGQQTITATAGQFTFVWTGDTILVGTTSTTNTNVKVYVDTGAGFVQ
jgi:methylaspartate ammonia-lyase